MWVLSELSVPTTSRVISQRSTIIRLSARGRNSQVAFYASRASRISVSSNKKRAFRKMMLDDMETKKKEATSRGLVWRVSSERCCRGKNPWGLYASWRGRSQHLPVPVRNERGSIVRMEQSEFFIVPVFLPLPLFPKFPFKQKKFFYKKKLTNFNLTQVRPFSRFARYFTRENHFYFYFPITFPLSRSKQILSPNPFICLGSLQGTRKCIVDGAASARLRQ